MMSLRRAGGRVPLHSASLQLRRSASALVPARSLAHTTGRADAAAAPGRLSRNSVPRRALSVLVPERRELVEREKAVLERVGCVLRARFCCLALSTHRSLN